MTITIPAWLLWTLGIGVGVPAALLLCAFAALGVAFVRCFSGGLWR
jgi:hypothetical protein